MVGSLDEWIAEWLVHWMNGFYLVLFTLHTFILYEHRTLYIMIDIFRMKDMPNQMSKALQFGGYDED